MQNEETKLDLVLLLDLNGVDPNAGTLLHNELLEAQHVLLERLILLFCGLKAAPDVQLNWRIKICGFGNHSNCRAGWFYDPPFSRSGATVLAQLKECLGQVALHGGPGSLLDALFKVTKMGQTDSGAPSDTQKWRAQNVGDGRAVIFFSPNAFRQLMTIPEAAGGGVSDVITAITTNKIILRGFCPEWSGYLDLATADRAELTVVATVENNSLLARLDESIEPDNSVELVPVRALAASGFIAAIKDPELLPGLVRDLRGCGSNIYPSVWNKLRSFSDSNLDSNAALGRIDQMINRGRRQVSEEECMK